MPTLSRSTIKRKEKMRKKKCFRSSFFPSRYCSFIHSFNKQRQQCQEISSTHHRPSHLVQVFCIDYRGRSSRRRSASLIFCSLLRYNHQLRVFFSLFILSFILSFNFIGAGVRAFFIMVHTKYTHCWNFLHKHLFASSSLPPPPPILPLQFMQFIN